MRITFRLKEDRDGDIIRWLRSLPGDPGRSFAIRQALRGAIGDQAGIYQGQRVSVEATPLTAAAEPGQDDAFFDDGLSPQGMGDADLEKKLDALF